MWNFKMIVLVRERGRTVIELHKIATEQSNERSKNIDKASTLEMLTIINEEDKEVPRAITRILPQIAVAVDCIAEHLKIGGRLFYIGAGTSGRLGILDAAECPPTYSTDPEMVQGIIAGGYAAIFKAQEGAEDSEEMARIDLKAKKIKETDVVVGLTASGRTPYVIGGLKYALECGAATIAITCTDNAETIPWAQISLTALVGPEVVTGSTRMLEVPTLTVGAPIKDKDGEILGAVLIHAPLSGMDMAAKQATRILLMCGGIALLAAFLIAVYSSWRFTKPLKTMQQTAEQMTEGDYTVRCDVRQNDEIGELGTALDSLGERLLIARKESAQLDQMRKDFIANISHELRTPVTVIRGSLEALNDKVVTVPEKVEEYYRQMLSETIFLQRLINDLLDLSRLQNLNFKIEMTKLNLYDVLLEAVHSSQRLGKDKNIDVVLETDTKWYPIDGDYGRLRQMLMIFMDNAVKFSPNNGQVKLVLQGKRLEIVDHGIGVAAQMVPHVFERFYKTRVEKNKSGTGLGLAIAKEIAERHGMEVAMESQPGVETKIILLLEKK